MFLLHYTSQQRTYYKGKIAKQREAVEHKLQAQQAQFNSERAHIVELVNEECGRIVREVYDLLQQRSLEGLPMPPLPAHLQESHGDQQFGKTLLPLFYDLIPEVQLTLLLAHSLPQEPQQPQ